MPYVKKQNIRKATSHPAFLFFILPLWLPASFAHGPCSYAFFPRHLTNEQKTELVRKFNEDAEYREDTLLLKTITYPESLPWFHEVLMLESNGDTYYGCAIRHTPERGAETVKLDDAHLNQIKHMLAHLKFTPEESQRLNPNSLRRHMVLFFEDFLRQVKQILVRLNVIDAKPLPRHTILVFHDGKTFRRYDFNGKLPDQAQKVIDLIRLGLKKQTDLKTNIPPD